MRKRFRLFAPGGVKTYRNTPNVRYRQAFVALGKRNSLDLPRGGISFINSQKTCCAPAEFVMATVQLVYASKKTISGILLTIDPRGILSHVHWLFGDSMFSQCGYKK